MRTAGDVRPPPFVVDSLEGCRPGDTVSLHGPEAHHAQGVMRLRSGDALTVVDGSGRFGTGRLTVAERSRVDVVLDDVGLEPEPLPAIVVVQALIKGDRSERAIESMTEVGVDRIVPWSAEHSISQWRDDRAERGVRKWRDAAWSAAKQSRRARFPEVDSLRTTPDVLELIRTAELTLVLDERADVSIADVGIPASGSVVLVVGPEGGLSDDERRACAAAGGRPVRLGPTVLRASTAGTVAAALVLSQTPRWRMDDESRMTP